MGLFCLKIILLQMVWNRDLGKPHKFQVSEVFHMKEWMYIEWWLNDLYLI
jgi:hypothetical protein